MKILIVYLKEDEKLKKCLDSLKEFSPEIEVIKRQADPTKTKVSEEVYQEYFNSNEFDDDVMLWHPDMIATKNWYVDLMIYYHWFDVIGVKLIYPNGLVNHYGGAIRFDGLGFHPHQYSLNIGLNNPLETAYVTGPGMIVKKHVWEKIKYDFQFFQYIDVDFCFQAREKGFKVGVVPVTLIHKEGEDGFKIRTPEKNAQMLKENHEKFVAKWMHILK